MIRLLFIAFVLAGCSGIEPAPTGSDVSGHWVGVPVEASMLPLTTDSLYLELIQDGSDLRVSGLYRQYTGGLAREYSSAEGSGEVTPSSVLLRVRVSSGPRIYTGESMHSLVRDDGRAFVFQRPQTEAGEVTP